MLHIIPEHTNRQAHTGAVVWPDVGRWIQLRPFVLGQTKCCNIVKEESNPKADICAAKCTAGSESIFYCSSLQSLKLKHANLMSNLILVIFSVMSGQMTMNIKYNK